MAIMTRWDAFQDLRGSQEQMLNQLYKLLTEARGQDAAESGTGGASAPAWAHGKGPGRRGEGGIAEAPIPAVTA